MPLVAVVFIGFAAGLATMAIVNFYKMFFNFWKKL